MLAYLLDVGSGLAKVLHNGLHVLKRFEFVQVYLAVDLNREQPESAFRVRRSG